MKIILIVLAIICISAFSIFKKKQIRYGSFDYPNIQVSGKKISEKACMKFLEEVNSRFGITSGYEILVHTDIGLEIYNTDTEDFISEIRSSVDTFAIRMNHLRDDRTTLSRVTSAKLMRNLLIPFEKYMKEHNVSGEFSVVDKNNSESVTVHFQEDESELPDDILYTDMDHLEFDHEYINQISKRYKSDGLFDSYPEDQIEKGVTYLKQYLHYSEGDFLWCFKNLITPISPEESGGYEYEVGQLEKGSNGNLKFTNYSEEFNEEFTQISVDINGITFRANNLPNWFSFEFLKQLNSFLSSNFSSGFYPFSWDRSPWEQMNFIYLTNEQFKKVEKSDLFTIGIIGQKHIDLYDEERIYKHRIRDAINGEFEKIGFTSKLKDPKWKSFSMVKEYNFGHEEIGIQIRVYGNYFVASFSLYKYLYKINDIVSSYYDKEAMNFSSFIIQLTHALPSKEKEKLKYGSQFSFEPTDKGLDSLKLECRRILEEYFVPFSQKLNDVSYLNSFFNDEYILPKEKQNMFFANEFNKTLKRMVMAKLANKNSYEKIHKEAKANTSEIIQKIEENTDYSTHLDSYKELSKNIDDLDKKLNSTVPLKNKNLIE